MSNAGGPGEPPAVAARPFTFDRSFAFPCARDELWKLLARVDEYPRWWTWLRAFGTDGELATGTTARATIRAPLPYRLDLSISVEEAVPSERIDARVRGDLEGWARLALSGGDESCRARLTWALTLEDRVLGRLAHLGRPLMTWGHDRVVSTGLRQFRSRALASILDDAG